MDNERVIRCDTFARSPFSAAIEQAQTFLQQAAARGGIDELVVASAVSSQVVDDYTDSVRRHEALEFRWRPRSPLFPAGRALLTVRPHAPQGAELQLSVAYVPPFGAIGQVFDACVGRSIAWITTALVLRRLRIEVERGS